MKIECIETIHDGCPATVWGYNDDENNFILHRENGPATITEIVYDDGYDDKSCYEEYYIHGKRHRNGKPAWIHISDKVFVTEIYYQNDMIHNDSGPAEIQYRTDVEDGLISKAWYIYNKLHNVNGPAVIDCDPETHTLARTKYEKVDNYFHFYYLDDRNLSKEEWEIERLVYTENLTLFL